MVQNYEVPRLPKNLQDLGDEAQGKLHALRFRDVQDPDWASGDGEHAPRLLLESAMKRHTAFTYWARTRRPEAKATRAGIRPNAARLKRRLERPSQ